MAGLAFFLIIAVWGLLSIAIGLLLTKLFKPDVAKLVMFLVAAPTIFFLPGIDGFLGEREFNRLCNTSDLRIYSSIPVGAELYTPTGEWRLAKFALSDADAFNRRVRYADSFVRREIEYTKQESGLVPVGQKRMKIYDRADNKLMAEWTEYTYSGGALWRNIWPGGTQCSPPELRGEGYRLYQKLFRFQP